MNYYDTFSYDFKDKGGQTYFDKHVGNTTNTGEKHATCLSRLLDIHSFIVLELTALRLCVWTM